MTTNKNKSSLQNAAYGLSMAVALMAAGAPQAATNTAPAKRPVATTSAGGSPCGRVEIAPMVTVPVGKSTVIRPQMPVTRILLGNPGGTAGIPGGGTEPPETISMSKPANQSADYAQGAGKHTKRTIIVEETNNQKDEGRPGVAQVDVLLLSPNEIYLLGKTVGSTNVVLVDRSGGCTALDVTVAMDVTSVLGALTALLPEEKDIKVSSAYDSLVLSGTVSDATKVDRAIDIATAYVRDGGGGQGGGGQVKRSPRVINMLQVGAPQQVMLEVKVAEVSKTVAEKMGVRVSGSSTTSGVVYNVVSDFLSGGNGLINIIRRGRDTRVTLDAQKDDGLVKILAEPNVIAISGQEGSFLSGGKIFIPVAQSNTNGAQTITLEEKEFGIALKFTPTVLAGGRINLKVAPEVSELNRDGIGISAPGVNGQAILPSFTTRRATTTVQLHDGQSFAIGGLIKNNVTTNIKAFPFLGEIPILGALFRSTDFQTDRSELVFVITPRLIRPLPADYQLPTDNFIDPGRADVHLLGRMEGTSRQQEPSAAAEAVPPQPAPAAGGFETR
ncbi:type II and III secretion system protein family protein [Azoarcus sp. DN11]|uniref:type II and III secretion system protein family protein n=1 Tax=Azoarcus sp. DN11 TaxID=356837 RepID=UPI000EAE92AB|nr:type II and III secretion system protein family protein [Azoarcus sp. DN11]AYH45633.1 outer membrane channel protein [Azoarcus sp. DN11]